MVHATNAGSGFDVTGSGMVDFDPGTLWAWARIDDSDGGDILNPYYSVDDLNADGLDHMVTYQITGLGTDATVWLVLWEDEITFDHDYNDLVVEISAVVPAPAAWCLLAVAGGAVRRRRR